MQFIIEDIDRQDHSRVVVRHNGSEIFFNIAKINRRGLQDHEPFRQLNRFLENAPGAYQDQVFSLYAKAEYSFTKVSQPWQLNNIIREIIHALVDDYFRPDRIKDYVLNDSEVTIPMDFEAEYIESVGRAGSRDQTYLKSDYAALITSVITLRSILPIWGTLLVRLSKTTNTEYSEYRAVKLLEGSEFWNGPAMTKLKLYVSYVVQRSKDRYKSLLSGISNDDYPDWMLGLVVVKRVAVGDIRGNDSYINLVKLIHKYISQKVDGDNAAGPNQIKAKNPPGEDDSDPDAKLSVAERFKIKHDLSIGELATIEYYASDPYRIASLLDPDIPMDTWQYLLPIAFTQSAELLNCNLVKPQITLVRWILSIVIAPKALLYCSKETMVGLIAVCQVYLYLRGFHELSVLISATPDTSDTFSISSNDVRGRTDPDNAKYLTDHYPYQRKLGGKEKGRMLSIAEHSIDLLIDGLTEYAWVITAGPLFREPAGVSNQNRILIPKDIKNQLIRLVFLINAQKEKLDA